MVALVGALIQRTPSKKQIIGVEAISLDRKVRLEVVAAGKRPIVVGAAHVLQSIEVRYPRWRAQLELRTATREGPKVVTQGIANVAWNTVGLGRAVAPLEVIPSNQAYAGLHGRAVVLRPAEDEICLRVVGHGVELDGPEVAVNARPSVRSTGICRIGQTEYAAVIELNQGIVDEG